MVIEAKDVFPNALSQLGVNVRRLHGMLPDPPSNRFMNLNFFGPGTGLVGIIDAEGQCVETAEGQRRCERISAEPERALLLAEALFRTTGPEGSSPSNHMSYWSPDGTEIIIANLGAKLLERIDYDQSTGTFTFNKAATLDLVGGRDLRSQPAMTDSTLPAGRVSGDYTSPQTTLTPSGVFKEGPGRPNNVVVCPIVTNKHTYGTFGGGGLFVVDITPDGRQIIVSFRGPHPITVKHAALGSCPGFGVVTLEGDGSTGRLTHVFRTFFSDHTGTRNLSDIHAAIVRRKRSM